MNSVQNNAKDKPDGEAAGKYRFPQAARLKVRGQFNAVFRDGAKGVGRALVIYLLPNDLECNRLGLAVGRKVGNAVRRNRVKRMIREAFRLESPTLPAGFDCVCIPRKGGFPDKSTDLIPLFRKTFLRALKRLEGAGDPP